jgi:hypothetical protein
MKHILLTTIAAVLLMGCGPSGDPPPLAHSTEDDRQDLTLQTDIEPVLFFADGLNADDSLVKNYLRGLKYAIDYFGNYGPYYIYLLGPDNEQSIRDIYLKRAESRANPSSLTAVEDQIEGFLKRPNIVAEIDAVLAGKAEGGLTWSEPPRRVYEDVTTNAKGRENDPIENTWGALHEYHHVFQIAHCNSYQERTSDRNLNSWMAEGMATYSSARFMENLNLIDFKSYMLELRKTGGNIGELGINDFISGGELGAWITKPIGRQEGPHKSTTCWEPGRQPISFTFRASLKLSS